MYTFQFHFLVMILSLVERVGPWETKYYSIVLFETLGNMYKQEITYLYVPCTALASQLMTERNKQTCLVVGGVCTVIGGQSPISKSHCSDWVIGSLMEVC